MFLIWGQKWGRYRRHHYGLPLRGLTRACFCDETGSFFVF